MSDDQAEMSDDQNDRLSDKEGVSGEERFLSLLRMADLTGSESSDLRNLRNGVLHSSPVLGKTMVALLLWSLREGGERKGSATDLEVDLREVASSLETQGYLSNVALAWLNIER